MNSLLKSKYFHTVIPVFGSAIISYCGYFVLTNKRKTIVPKEKFIESTLFGKRLVVVDENNVKYNLSKFSRQFMCDDKKMYDSLITDKKVSVHYYGLYPTIYGVCEDVEDCIKFST